jgi:hypothetical protein
MGMVSPGIMETTVLDYLQQFVINKAAYQNSPKILCGASTF